MSRIPEIKVTKYNQSKPYAWVDSQLEKLLTKQEELLEENCKLNKQILELTMENAELKDIVLDNGGEYAETDGYEVGSPSDYEEDKQLSFDFEVEKNTENNDFEVKRMIHESPDGGKTIYSRELGDYGSD